MKSRFSRPSLGATVALSFFLCCLGCDQTEVQDSLKQAEEQAKQVAEDAAGEAKAMAEEGKQMAENLGAEVMGYINPLKEKLGNLEGLKDAPEKLKTAVNEALAMIESKADSIELPESIASALESIKEKLLALKTYLEGEVEEAKVGEQIQSVMDAVNSAFPAANRLLKFRLRGGGRGGESTQLWPVPADDWDSEPVRFLRIPVIGGMLVGRRGWNRYPNLTMEVQGSLSQQAS